MKRRLDQAVVEAGLADTRSRAQALIMAGEVLVDGKCADKPGSQVRPGQRVGLKHEGKRWVSRGAMKLLHAIEHLGLEVTGLTAIDVGASTGGFTQVLLEHGAARVFAVDVGHGQLAWNLRQDPRVIVMERTNARHLTLAQIPEPVDLVVCDASFIGLATVLPAALSLTAPNALCCALIKPQFEAGRAHVGKGGVVRDASVHARVCAEVSAWFDNLAGWRACGIEPSPILGPKGNREFLILARKTAPGNLSAED